MTTEARPKRQTKKLIWDWQTIDAAIAANARLPKQTDISQFALARAEHHQRHNADARIAQMDERIVAVGMPNCIGLWYLHTPKQEPLDKSNLNCWVFVYPGAGGRTAYKIDDSVNGWFANARLPLNASDRRKSSSYRSEQWFHGQHGVYQPGHGPYYPDAGPDCCNPSEEQMVARVNAAVHLPEKWREAASALVHRICAAVAPFRDIVVRYTPFMPDEDSVDSPYDRFQFRSILRTPDPSGDLSGNRHVHLSARYGLTVRLKSPCAAGDGGWRATPDLAISCAGDFRAFDEFCDVAYTVQMLHPQGPSGTNEWVGDETYQTGVPFCVTRHQGRVVEAARQWAASHIYIPCV